MLIELFLFVQDHKFKLDLLQYRDWFKLAYPVNAHDRYM